MLFVSYNHSRSTLEDGFDECWISHLWLEIWRLTPAQRALTNGQGWPIQVPHVRLKLQGGQLLHQYLVVVLLEANQLGEARNEEAMHVPSPAHHELAESPKSILITLEVTRWVKRSVFWVSRKFHLLSSSSIRVLFGANFQALIPLPSALKSPDHLQEIKIWVF